MYIADGVTDDGEWQLASGRLSGTTVASNEWQLVATRIGIAHWRQPMAEVGGEATRSGLAQLRDPCGYLRRDSLITVSGNSH